MPGRLAQISRTLLDNAREAGRAYEERSRLGRGGLLTQSLIDTNSILIKNGSGGDLLRGSILEIGDNQLTKLQRGNLAHDGTQPSGSDIDFAILTEPAKSNKWVRGQLAGVCIALVNVTNTNHTHAQPEDGEGLLQSGTSGPIKILDSLSSTGEQELPVKFARAESITYSRFQTLTTDTTVSDGAEMNLNASPSSSYGNTSDYSVSGSRITAETAGVYRIEFVGSITLGGTYPITWEITIVHDDGISETEIFEAPGYVDTYNDPVSGELNPTSGHQFNVSGHINYQLSEDDEIAVKNTSGGSVTISPEDFYVTLERLGPVPS